MAKSIPVFSRLIVLATIVASASSLVAAQDSATPTDREANAPTIESASRGSLRSVLRPIADVRLSARAAGVIERFHVDEGATVRVGDPIISLDMDTEKAEVLQAEAVLRGAKAELDRAIAEFERTKSLSNENIFSEKQLLETKTIKEIAFSRNVQAEASLAMARARLMNRTISSPINGIFLKSNKSAGEAVERFEIVARVIDISALEMVVFGDSRFFATFRTLENVDVQIFISPSQQPIVKAKVAHIDPIIDPSSGTFRIKLHLSPSSEVAPGYTAILVPPSS